MKLAFAAVAIAWATILVGLTLAVRYARGLSVPKALLWLHPLLAVITVACLWTAVALWSGKADYFFNSGTFVVSLAFVAGGLLYAVRKWGGRPPLIVTGMHGAVAILGSVLLIVGLVG
ncbi:MAG TPA: hypothetical protein VF271_10100 [Rhodanobacteraceae bacterium]